MKLIIDAIIKKIQIIIKNHFGDYVKNYSICKKIKTIRNNYSAIIEKIEF